MKLELTVGAAKKQLNAMDSKWDESDKSYRAAMVLLFGTINNKCTVQSLKEYLDYPTAEIKEFVSTIKKEKMWVQNMKSGKLDKEQKWIAKISDWWDEKNGGISFLLDVNRTMGFITRA